MLVIPSEYIKQPGIENRNSCFFNVWVFISFTSIEIISISQLTNIKKKLNIEKGARYCPNLYKALSILELNSEQGVPQDSLWQPFLRDRNDREVCGLSQGGCSTNHRDGVLNLPLALQLLHQSIVPSAGLPTHDNDGHTGQSPWESHQICQGDRKLSPCGGTWAHPALRSFLKVSRGLYCCL